LGELLVSENRLNKLEAMLADDPDDGLLKYMLALELEKASDHDRSLQLLAELMSAEPPYVPAFLMAGQQSVTIGQPEAARTIWQAGIQAARDQDDEHAAGEMAQFINDLV
jgi:predicted Zn-dependent protease